MNDFNVEDVKKYDNEKLCAIIITYKYFNNHFDVIKVCMEELSNRRKAGSNFQFEEYIQTEFNKLPKLDMKMDIKNILSNVGNLGKFKL